MARGPCLVLASVALAGAGTPGAAPSAAPPPEPLCGRVVPGSDQVWSDRFSLDIEMRAWTPFQIVRVAFESEVTADNVFGAELDAERTRSYVNEVVLTLPIVPSGVITILGHGRGDVSAVTCLPMDLPPPAPPHEADCPLVGGAKGFETSAVWDSGEISTVSLETWVSNKVRAACGRRRDRGPHSHARAPARRWPIRRASAAHTPRSSRHRADTALARNSRSIR